MNIHEKNPNQSALNEMAIAQQKLAEAYTTFGLLMQQIEESEQHFRSANQVSINREQACYQTINAEVVAHYAILKLSTATLAQAFQMPLVRRMILSIQQQSLQPPPDPKNHS